jgi:DNA polymerase-3 subunit delta'
VSAEVGQALAFWSDDFLARLQGHREVLARLESLATQGRTPPSLIFSGPSGIGKKRVALEFAQALVGDCKTLDLDAPMSMTEHILYVRPDGASIKIDQVREANQFLQHRRLGRARVLIFDEAHLLNEQAANAMLKSVEEPPEHTHFLFITPSASQVLPTIRSRSQALNFAPLTSGELSEALKLQGVKIALTPDLEALCGGSVAVALENLGDEVALEIAQAVKRLMQALGTNQAARELQTWKDLVKERDQHVLVSRLLVQEIADAWREEARIGEYTPSASAHSAGAPARRQLEKLSQLALEAQADLYRNVDRHLIWENFVIASQRALR